MITFPNAKINLGLNITSKRPDGYHNLSSCFLPIKWQDVLEAIPSPEFEFQSTGLDIPGNASNNLCVLAYEMLKDLHDIPPVKMHLHKVIPMGAGLGGGSADGAFALKLLNDLFELGLTVHQLESYAKQLGADCPFFIDNTPKIVSGIGEILESTQIDLSPYTLLVVCPAIHVNTQTAFAGIVPSEPETKIKDALNSNIESWQNSIKNDFEKSVFDNFPLIKSIKDSMIAEGGLYASMTGTGSAVFGIFNKAPNTHLFKDHDIWLGKC
jgi:4-diphosphocytidyl-2-C-methyl-D-erythritol kinase